MLGPPVPAVQATPAGVRPRRSEVLGLSPCDSVGRADGVVPLVAALLLLPITACSAQDGSVGEVAAGDFRFSIVPRVGPVVTVRGLPIIEGGFLRFHSPDWRTNYLSLGDREWARLRSVEKTDLPDGGQRVTATAPERGGIKLGLTFELHPDGSMLFAAEYAYEAGSPPCNLEWAVAGLPPGPCMGQWCTDASGVRRLLPIRPLPEEERSFFRSPSACFQSRLGEVRVDVADGSGGTLNLTDWRGYGRNMRLASFLLFRSAKVEPGATARLCTRIDVTVSPAREAGAAAGGVGDVVVEPPPRYRFPLIPAPKVMEPSDGHFDCARRLTLVARREAAGREQAALRILAGEIGELLGTRPDMVVGGGTTRPVAWLATSEAGDLTGPAPDGQWDASSEGYAVSVGPEAITMAGADVRGLWYATRTAYQVLANAHDASPESPLAPCCSLASWPDHAIRGMHLPLRCRSDLGLIEELIRCMGLYHYNLLILEAFDAIRYDEHPLASAPDAYDKATVRRLVGLATRHGLEVVPGINSLGHAQEWLFQPYRLARLAEFKDIVEDPARPEVRRQRTLCPSNPRTRELLFGIYGELLDLTGAQRFFVGLDEAFDWGVCDRCKGRDPAALFAGHTNALHAYLKGRGVDMIMFQDMMLEEGKWPLGVPCHSHGTASAAEKIPREGLLMCCWQYTTDTEYPAFKHFLDMGFRCVGASWFQPENIWGYSRYVHAQGGDGMIGTTWVPHGSSPGHWQLRTARSRLAAYARGGDAFWSCGLPATAPEDEGYSPETEIERHYGRHRRDTNSTLRAIDIDASRNWRLEDTRAGDRVPAAFDYGPDHDMSCLLDATTGMGGTPFHGLGGGRCIALRGGWEPNVRAPESVPGIVVDANVRGLLFLHTCGWEVARGTPVARYTIHFADGTHQVQEVLYGRDVLAFDSDGFPYDRLDAGRVWLSLVGRSRGGQALRFHVLRWSNPRPGVKVTTVDLASRDTVAAPVLLGITAEAL